jgi:Tfp pilus assembly protein PilZ
MSAARKLTEHMDIEPRSRSRQSPRADAYFCIDLCTEDQFWTGLTMNLSESGVFVATHVMLAAGSVVGIHLELPRPDERILTLGEVRWTREYSGNDDIPPGLGIAFVGLDLQARAAIGKLVATSPLSFKHAGPSSRRPGAPR